MNQPHAQSVGGIEDFLYDGVMTGSNPKDRSPWVQAGNYAQLAFVLPAAIVVGWLIGVGLDKWLHTTWLYIVGLILGIIAGFVELIRTVSKNS